MSHEQANKMHGNPHYGESKAYSVNCQTCVVAYELRLRGFDVSALPNTADSALSKLSKATHTAWQGITREDISVIAKTTLDKYGHIKQPPLKWVKVSAAMTETGRYHIAWRWKRKRSGHIITAERLPDGSLRFYDPQNGMSGALDLYKKILPETSEFTALTTSRQTPISSRTYSPRARPKPQQGQLRRAEYREASLRQTKQNGKN